MKQVRLSCANLLRLPALVAAILFALVTAPMPAAGQALYYGEEFEPWEYEYEPGEGLHEEEWYDPSDWFDISPSISYETDDWTEGYNYGYDDNDYNEDYYDAAEYGRTEYERDYGRYYDRTRNEWRYGWHYETDDDWFDSWYE